MGGLRCVDGLVYLDPSDTSLVPCGTWAGCPRGEVVHTCRDGCGWSSVRPATPANLCRDGGPRRAGDLCTSDAECSPAEPVTGPDGVYTPSLACGAEGRCVEIPTERCDARDDDGDGEVDEGCALVIASIPSELEGNVMGASVSRSVDGEELGVLFGIDAFLAVLDEELTLVGRTPTLSPSGSFVVGGSEGFVVQTDALRDGEPATDLHVIGRDARVLRAIALGEQRPTFLARYVDGRIDLIGPATALTRRDASDGSILGEVALDRIAWSAVHRVGDVLALCDRFDDRVTWIEPDLTIEQVDGRCGEVQSREGPRFWSWDRFWLTRWVDRAPTDDVIARVGDLLASVVVAGEDEAFAGFLRDRELVVVHAEASGRGTPYVVALEGEELVAEGVVLGGRLVLVLNDPFTRRVRFVTLEARP